jgi:SSS family solute:Na+ symporter
METRTAIIIGLLAYVIVTSALSVFLMTRVRKAADYLVAGRGLPFWALAGTIIGTCIGTGVIVGGSGLAYNHGWAGCAYPIGLGVGTLLTGLCFAKMRRYSFMTLSEEIACYYEKNRIIVEFSNLTLFFSQLCWLTVQIMGGAAVMGAVTGLQPRLCVVLAGFAKAIISIPGGLKAVVYTDVLQTFILFSGFGAMLVSALRDVGGIAGLHSSVPADYFSFLGVTSYGAWNVAGLILVLVLNPIADPGRRLSIYSARSERAAWWSMATSGIVVILFSIAIGITGMYAYKLNPGLKVGDQALPWLVMNVLPAWLAALVVVAIVSGISSAANGNAAAAGTFFVRHIYPLCTGKYPRNPVLVARYALICAFFASTIVALYTTSIVDFVKKFLPLTMSGLAVIIMLGRFWKRSNWQGALAALIVTPAVSLLLMFSHRRGGIFDNPIIVASLVGLLAHVIVTCLTPAPQMSFETVAEAMARERQNIEGASAHSTGSPTALHV